LIAYVAIKTRVFEQDEDVLVEFSSKLINIKVSEIGHFGRSVVGERNGPLNR
jgi:hypothetical protein